MVYEHAIITIKPGSEADFEAAYAKARRVILGGGATTADLSRCVEEPACYLLLATWETVEAHTQGFRGSPAFAEWRALIGPHFAADPVVTHYAPVSISAS